MGGIKIEKGEIDEDYEDEDEDAGAVKLEVQWVTAESRMSGIKSYFVAYGNEASLGAVYGEFNVIVTVADRISRRK
jgi:hypothetical protein